MHHGVHVYVCSEVCQCVQCDGAAELHLDSAPDPAAALIPYDDVCSMYVYTYVCMDDARPRDRELAHM